MSRRLASVGPDGLLRKPNAIDALYDRRVELRIATRREVAAYRRLQRVAIHHRRGLLAGDADRDLFSGRHRKRDVQDARFAFEQAVVIAAVAPAVAAFARRSTAFFDALNSAFVKVEREFAKMNHILAKAYERGEKYG